MDKIIRNSVYFSFCSSIKKVADALGRALLCPITYLLLRYTLKESKRAWLKAD